MQHNLQRNHAELVADAICDDPAMCSLAHEDGIARKVHGWLVQRIGREAAGSFEHPACLELEEQLHSLYGAAFDAFVAFVAGIMEAKPLRLSDVPVVLVSKLARSYQIAAGMRQRLLDEGNPGAFHGWGEPSRNDLGRIRLGCGPDSQSEGDGMTRRVGGGGHVPCVALSHASRLVAERMREVQRRCAADALALRVFTAFAVRKGLDPAILRTNLAPFFLRLLE